MLYHFVNGIGPWTDIACVNMVYPGTSVWEIDSGLFTLSIFHWAVLTQMVWRLTREAWSNSLVSFSSIYSKKVIFGYMQSLLEHIFPCPFEGKSEGSS